MNRLLKFWYLPSREKQFFCEAGILLLVSHLSVKTIAFKHIHGFLSRDWKDYREGDADRPEDVELVNLSLSRVANLLPWQSLCLSRSIAAFIMLRRRGIPVVLVAGVRFLEDSSLDAHAWVYDSRERSNVYFEKSTFRALIRIGQEPSNAGSTRGQLD